MRTPPLILSSTTFADNVEILQLRLESQGYEVILAARMARPALATIRDRRARPRAARHHDAEARRHRRGQGS